MSGEGAGTADRDDRDASGGGKVQGPIDSRLTFRRRDEWQLRAGRRVRGNEVYLAGKDKLLVTVPHRFPSEADWRLTRGCIPDRFAIPESFEFDDYGRSGRLDRRQEAEIRAVMAHQ